MKIFKRFALIILIVLTAVCAAVGLSACAKDEDKALNHDTGVWDNLNGIYIGMVSDKDCPAGNIDESKVKADLEMQTGEEYYLIVDFNLQAVENNDGTGSVDLSIKVAPLATVSVTIQEAPSGTYTESVVGDAKEISLQFSIPDKAETIRGRRIVLSLKPVWGSEQTVDVSLNADMPLAGGLGNNEIHKAVTTSYTNGLEYTETDDGGYSVAVGEADGEAQIVIPYFKDGKYVTEIGEDAFIECENLTKITIPESVSIIDEYAFYGCYEMTELTIPDSVTDIGNCAFDGCCNLTSLTIPAGVTSIGWSAFSSVSGVDDDYIFYGYSSLTCIVVNENNPKYYSEGNCIIEKDSKTVILGCRNSVIPNDVKSIGACAFTSSGITSVTIPESVISIGNYAFSGCVDLTSLTIPKNVTSIGYGAFGGCVGISSFVIPEGITEIKDWTFTFCRGLESVIIPDSVKSIGYRAFYYCRKLTNITIPDSVTNIDSWAFAGCDLLTSIIIPDSVTSIGESVFNSYMDLLSIYYKGTAEEWGSLRVDINDYWIDNAAIYYYSETEPTASGDYWHYVDGVPAVW